MKHKVSPRILGAITFAIFSAALLFAVAPSVFAADGSGTNTVNPTSTIISTTGNTFTFTFTAVETMDSGEIKLTTPSNWSTIQGVSGTAGYTTATSTTGGMIADVVNNADSATNWQKGSGCGSIALSTSTRQEGSGSIECGTLAQGANKPLQYYRLSSAVNWSAYTKIGFWIDSSVAVPSNILEFAFSSANNLGSPQHVSIATAIPTSTWTYVNLNLGTTTRSSILSYGLQQVTADTAINHANIFIDDILAGPGSATFPGGGTIDVRLLQLANTQTVTFIYGSGGGTSGVAAPSTAQTDTATTTDRVSDAGTLTDIASQPTLTAANPVPTTTSISPTSTTASSTSFTLTANGTNFVTNSVVDWDGSERTTTFASSTQLTATITAADVATPGTASVTVVNPTPGGGTSNAQTFTINPVNTTTTVNSSATSSVYGSFVTFTATVTPASGGAPTGTVTFKDGASVLGTATLNGTNPGIATFSTSTLSVSGSPHLIVAVYGAAGIFAGSISTAISQMITAKPLTVIGITANDKTYDASTTATLVGTPGTLVGIVDGDFVSLTGTAVGTFATSSAGNNILVTVSGQSLTGAQASNYSLTEPTTTANITQQNLTVTGITANDKVYDGTTAATLNTGGATLVGVISGDTVVLGTGSAVGTFSTSSVGTNIPVAVSGLTISGAQSSDYSLTEPTTTASITNPVPTTISILPASTTAGGVQFMLTVSGTNFNASSTVDFNGSARATTFVSSTTLTATITAGDIATAGTASITVVNPTPGGGISNAQTFTINNPVPTLTSISSTSTNAGSSGFALTLTGTNFVASSSVLWNGSARATTFVSSTSLQAAILTSDLTTPTTSAVTVMNPSPGGGTSNSQTFTINPINTITTVNSSATSSVYGNSVTFTATVTPAAGGPPTGTVTFNDGATALGTGTLNGANPGVATFSTSTLSVAGSPHSIIAVYGGDSNFSGSTSTVLSQIITVKALTVIGITANDKTYDASTTATLVGTPGTLVGIVDGDFVSLTGTAVGTFATSSAGNNILVTVSGQSLTGAQASNYSLTEPTTTANITQQNLTVTGITANDKVYDGTTAATLNTGGATLVGVIAGDTVTLNTASAVGTFVTSSVGSDILVQVSGLTISGAQSPNYSLTQPTTTASILNPVPTTTSLSPASTTAGSSDFTLTIDGTNFVSGSVVNWNGSSRATTFVSSTEVTATVTASDVNATGTASVTVANPAPGGGISNSETFTVTTPQNPAPALTAISPTSTEAGSSGFTLTLIGTGFISTSQVQWDGFNRTTIFVSSTTLTADILDSDVAAGEAVSVTVVNLSPGGGTSNAETFTITNPAPTTTSVNPTSTPAGSSDFMLTVNGTNFVSNSVVDFNGVAEATTFISDDQAMATINASDVATVGTYPVVVMNPAPGGGTSNSQTFTVTTPTSPVPTTTSISPTSTSAGGSGFTLTVNGSNFVSSSTVDFNGSPRTTTFVSSSQLTATITTADIATGGMDSITVVNPAPGGGASNAQTLAVVNPAPITTSLLPASIAAGSSDFTLTIDGTNFVSGSVVNWNGSSRATTFVSSTEVTATVTASDVNATGTASVTVANPAPGGGISNSETFTVTAATNPVPTLTSISPTSTDAGSPDFTLTIFGSDFISNSVIDFNGMAVTTTFASSTELTAIIPAVDVTATGTFPVAVVNPTPGGGTSGNQTFTVTAAMNPVPTLTSISPTSVIAGGSGLTLTVSGTNFFSGSVVNWNDSGLATTFVSSSTITALVTATDVAAASTSSIAVINPAPGGGTSGNVVFTVNSPASSSSAIKFIFANVTSSAIAGNTVTFNIEAVNSSGTIDTSFEQGVTLTVSGSGTGGGLVTIIDGVGTSTVSDNVAETAALRLEDSQVTGLDVSSVADVTFVPGPVARFILDHPGNMNVGTRLGYTVSREDQFGNLVSVSGTEIYLYTNSPSSNAAFFNMAAGGGGITSITIPDGSTSTVFWYYDDTSGSRTVTASDNPIAPDGSVGIADASDAFTVAPGAVKFIFANVPSSVTAGNGVSVNVNAVDSSGNIITSFNGGVTITTSGSASGGGLVNIANGVGVTTIKDLTAETVTVGFRDTQNTGLGVGATVQIVFNPAPTPPPQPVTPSVSTGGVVPTQVPFGIKPGITITFSGMAYPGTTVTVIRKDLGLQAAPVTQAVPAAADGSFLVELDNVLRLTGQTYLLSFVDKNGLIAQTKAYNIPVQDKIVYGNILAAPTLGFENSSVVTKGQPLVITGYATPNATVELFVDGNPAGTVLVNDPTGKYTYPLDTDTLSSGRHAVWAIQKSAESATEVSGYTNSLSNDEIFVDDATNGTLIAKNASSGLYAFIPAITGGTGGGVLPVVVGQTYTKQAESDFSNQESFTVSPLANPKLDLNGDGVVDIKDLSIFLSYLKNLNADVINFHITDPTIVKTLDFNGDGVVDVRDLDILMAAILHP